MLRIKKKKMISYTVAIMIIFVIVLAGFVIRQHYALNQAKHIARQHVSESAEFVTYYKDKNIYTIKYFDKNQQERIEIEVDINGNKIRKMQTQKIILTEAITITPDNKGLIKIVENENPGASIKIIDPSDYPGKKYVTLAFTAPDLRGLYMIDPLNGSVLARTIKFSKPVAIPLSLGDENTGFLSLQEFKQIGEQKVHGSVFQDLDIIYSDGNFNAEIDLYLGGIKYKLVIDACNGKEITYKFYKDEWNEFGEWDPEELVIPLLNIVNFDDSLTFSNYFISPVPSLTDTNKSTVSSTSIPPTPTISPPTPSILPVKPTKAIAIPTKTPEPTKMQAPKIIDIDGIRTLVLKRLPGANISTIDLDEDRNRLLYKGNAKSGDIEVEFEIDAYTGIFIEWDVETDD
ncbi:MAG: PepSY domain-containing protein [Saccharofermentanales bacterium]